MHVVEVVERLQVLAAHAEHAESAVIVHVVRRAWPAAHEAVQAAQGGVPEALQVEPATQYVVVVQMADAEFHDAPAAHAQPDRPVVVLAPLYAAPVGHGVQAVLPVSPA